MLRMHKHCAGVQLLLDGPLWPPFYWIVLCTLDLRSLLDADSGQVHCMGGTTWMDLGT
jgi:hypothetical protein